MFWNVYLPIAGNSVNIMMLLEPDSTNARPSPYGVGMKRLIFGLA